MSSEFRFVFDLQQHGWADLTVELDGEVAELRTSYMSHALKDLLDAVWGLTNGAPETSAYLEREPTEWRWRFQRDRDVVAVDIAELEHRRDAGRSVVAGMVPLAVLAQAFVSEAKRLLDTYGEDGYRERWVADDFPATSLERLSAWVEGIER